MSSGKMRTRALKLACEVADLLASGGIMTAVDVRWSPELGVQIFASVGRDHVGVDVERAMLVTGHAGLIVNEMTAAMRAQLEKGRGAR